MKTINEVGNRYGRLTVLRRDGSTPNGEAKWLCRCDCGREKAVRGADLRNGHTKSCGCLEQETRKINGSKTISHGMSNSRLYKVWHGMKARCYRGSHPHFKDYGGRGIKVCDEWLNSFTAFAEWANTNGYDEYAGKGKCTLDRINPDGDYTPSNCRFADMNVQQNNRRDRSGKQCIKGDDGIYHIIPNCGAKVVS